MFHPDLLHSDQRTSQTALRDGEQRREALKARAEKRERRRAERRARRRTDT